MSHAGTWSEHRQRGGMKAVQGHSINAATNLDTTLNLNEIKVTGRKISLDFICDKFITITIYTEKEN